MSASAHRQRIYYSRYEDTFQGIRNQESENTRAQGYQGTDVYVTLDTAEDSATDGGTYEYAADSVYYIVPLSISGESKLD